MKQQTNSYSIEELEKQKLVAEIANLKKSWLKNPASWVSILTIVLALFGLAFQYRNHEVEAREAQIKLDKANDDLKAAQGSLKAVQNELDQKEPRLKQIDEEIDKATSDLKDLTSEREGVQNQLAALNAQLKELEAKTNSLPNTADNQKIRDSVKVASGAVADLQTKNLAIAEKSKAVTETLGRAKARTSLVPR